MAEFIIMNNRIILWGNWVINKDDLTTSFLSKKHPFTGQQLSWRSRHNIVKTIKFLSGNWWLEQLKSIRDYEPLLFDNLTSAPQLGKGAFATVYSYKNYAVKAVKRQNYGKIKINGETEANVFKTLMSVVKANHTPGIVLFYEYNNGNLVLEKMDCSLAEYLTIGNEPQIKGVILQVLFTLLILQRLYPGFRHNDLKVDNILLDTSTVRNAPITLQYHSHFWNIPVDAPLAKVADFDYTVIPGVIENNRVGTSYTKKFGCSREPNDIYDVHLFLNSLFIYRKHLPKSVRSWIKKQLPAITRGKGDAVKFGRLKDPQKWVGKIHSPLNLLRGGFFKEFRQNTKAYPLWGI